MFKGFIYKLLYGLSYQEDYSYLQQILSKNTFK